MVTRTTKLPFGSLFTMMDCRLVEETGTSLEIPAAESEPIRASIWSAVKVMGDNRVVTLVWEVK